MTARQEGDGIPDLATTKHVVEVLKEVGFKIIDVRDLAPESEIPWYQPLDGSWDLSNIRATRVGRMFTHVMVNVLEFLHLAPKGTVKTHDFLIKVWVRCLKSNLFSVRYVTSRGTLHRHQLSSRRSHFVRFLILMQASNSLVAGGKLGIFTPMFAFVVEKPKGK
jgi:hypothetical protein